MARTTERLSALQLLHEKRPGYYADGANLYFRVAPLGARGWIFRFTIGGRTRDMGLGPYPQIGLAAARRLGGRCRELVTEGVDPIERRRSDRAEERVAAARSLTFEECAKQCVKDREAGWRNSKHRKQWSRTLERYASPVLGKLPVSAIDRPMVLRTLKPIWTTKPETASRLRGRIETVLSWASVHGYRTGENPARWKGNLDQVLPARGKIRAVTHHAALPYGDVGDFMAQLRNRPEVAARALELTILTAVRTEELIGARPTELNLTAKVWTVPAGRMKGKREHRVPLSRPALDLLEVLPRDGEFLFPGLKLGRPLSNMAMLKVLERMSRDDVTVHGFRSTFRDWASETTGYPNHVVEMALAHVIGDKVEAAYRRGDLFEKRRRLMEDWGRYCARSSDAAVIPFRVGV